MLMQNVAKFDQIQPDVFLWSEVKDSVMLTCPLFKTYEYHS